MAFEDDDAAGTFLAGYEDLLRAHGGEPVDGFEVDGVGGIYRIRSTNDFSGTYWFARTGNRVTIVHAPTVDELVEIHDGVSFREAGTPVADPQPGFGGIVAIATLLILTLLLNHLYRGP